MKTRVDTIGQGKPEAPAVEGKRPRITPERIAGVVLDSYSPQRIQLRKAVAGILRAENLG